MLERGAISTYLKKSSKINGKRRGRPIFETRLAAFPRPKRLLGLLPARKVIGLKSLGAELFWI
jgi:hypothetical protein